MKVERSEIEKKMRCLIGQYQRNTKKAKSGAGADGDPKWPFFNMFAFLKDKCKPRSYCESGQSTDANEDSLLLEEDDASMNSDQSQAGLSKSREQPILKPPQTKPGPKKRKPSQMVEEAYQAMKKITSTLDQNNQDDEFDVYGKHVGNELRGLGDKLLQAQAKNEINKILYDFEIRKIQSVYSGSTLGASSVSVSRPNSALFGDDESEDCFASVLLKM